jgi:hypothetical protein
MELALVIFLVVALLVMLDGAAAGWGVDSRTDSGDPRQRDRGLFVH